MLAIRMQRTGRRGHAQFRVIVQEAHRTPTSGKVVAHLGHHNPHSKETVLDKDKAVFYLEHGAQPTPRVVSVLKTEKVKLPDWVEKPLKKKRAIRHPEKLRKNRPAEPKKSAEETPAVEQASEEAPAAEAPEATEGPTEAPADEKPAEEPKAEEAPAEQAEATAEEAPAKENAEEAPAAEPESEEEK